MSERAIQQDTLTEVDKEAWRELHDKNFEDLTDEEITSKIRLSVKRRFSYPEWVVMFEYGAPGSNGRVADAIALNTLPSRNFKIVGFEFKASRSDWLRELKDGQKADYFVRLVDEWYVVAPKGVIQESEIPDGWGYLEMKPNSEQLYKLRDSELTEYQQGDPDRRFWMKFIKEERGEESNYDAQDLREAEKRGYEKAKKEGITNYQKKRHLEKLERKANNWDQLEEAGFDFLPNYRFDEEAVRTLELAWKLVDMMTRDNYSSLRGTIEYLQEDIERQAESMMESAETLESGFDKLEERLTRHPTPLDSVGGESDD